MLAFGLAYGMMSTSAVNTSMPMMSTVVRNNLNSVQATPSLYSINNMAASLLTQSKFSKQANPTRHSFKQQFYAAIFILWKAYWICFLKTKFILKMGEIKLFSS